MTSHSSKMRRHHVNANSLFNAIKKYYPFVVNHGGLGFAKRSSQSKWLIDNFGKHREMTGETFLDNIDGWRFSGNEAFVRFYGNTFFKQEEHALMFKMLCS